MLDLGLEPLVVKEDLCTCDNPPHEGFGTKPDHVSDLSTFSVWLFLCISSCGRAILVGFRLFPE